jgi:hypothetical protein
MGTLTGSRGTRYPEEDRTDARMHHDSPVTSVTAGLALLACVETEAIKTAADQPEFGGSEKDGDPQATESAAANSASCDVWQDKATLAYLRTGRTTSRPSADRCRQGPGPTPS